MKKHSGTEAMAACTTIAVVDDHPVIRDGLAIQLGMEKDFKVVGNAGDLATAINVIESTKPDVAIIDLMLEDGNGIDLIKRIRALDNPVRIVVLSMHSDLMYVDRALRAGAQGYLPKSHAVSELVNAIRAVAQGRIYLSPADSDRLLSRLATGRATSDVATLSDREIEMFELIGQGLSTEQVAGRMHISPKTVETYRARVKAKLGVGNINELMHRAVQWVLQSREGEQ